MKEFDINTFIKLRMILTKGCSDSLIPQVIDSHPDIKKEDIQEILIFTRYLNQYIKKFTPLRNDYYINSLKGCYTLSSLFVLFNSSWSLEQGVYKELKTFRHSWIQRNDVIYDPAFRIITLTSLYDEFFLLKHQYSSEQVRKILERTGKFYYYEVDLQENYEEKEIKLMIDEMFEKMSSIFQEKHKTFQLKTNVY